jgi:hypothetical protein
MHAISPTAKMTSPIASDRVADSNQLAQATTRIEVNGRSASGFRLALMSSAVPQAWLERLARFADVEPRFNLALKAPS